MPAVEQAPDGFPPTPVFEMSSNKHPKVDEFQVAAGPRMISYRRDADVGLLFDRDGFDYAPPDALQAWLWAMAGDCALPFSLNHDAKIRWQSEAQYRAECTAWIADKRRTCNEQFAALVTKLRERSALTADEARAATLAIAVHIDDRRGDLSVALPTLPDQH